MANTAMTRTCLLFLLTALPPLALPDPADSTTASLGAFLSGHNSEDHHAVSTASSTPDLQGPLPNVSCPEVVPDGSFQSGAVGNWSCLPLPDDNSSLPADAASTSPAPSSGSGFNIINTGSWSAETFDNLQEIINYCSIPVILVGSLLNAFSVAVYLQPAMRSCSSTYLAALCLAQLLYLISNIPVTLLRIVVRNDGFKDLASFIVAFTLGLYLPTVMKRLTFTLTFIVCLERLLAVAFPLKFRQMRLSSHPARVSIVCALSVAILHVYLLMKFEFIPTTKGNYVAKVRAFFVENETIMSALALVLSVMFAYMTLVGTIVVNVLTTVVMRRHRQTSQHLTTNRDTAKEDKAEKQTTLAILVSSFVFVLLSLPFGINSLLNDFLPEYGYLKKEHYLCLSVDSIIRLLQYFSTFLDFFSYVIISKRFRMTFVKMFRGKGEQVTQNNKTTEQSTSDTDAKA